MFKKLLKFENAVKIIGFVVLGLSAILALVFFLKDAPGLDTELAKIDGLSSTEKQLAVSTIAGNWSAGFLNFTIGLFFVSVGLIVIFSLYKFVHTLITEPRNAVKSIVSVVAFAAVIIVAFLMASDTIPVFVGSDKIEMTPRMVKWVDTALFSTYIIFGAAIVMTIYSEISKIWR